MNTSCPDRLLAFVLLTVALTVGLGTASCDDETSGAKAGANNGGPNNGNNGGPNNGTNNGANNGASNNGTNNATNNGDTIVDECVRLERNCLSETEIGECHAGVFVPEEVCDAGQVCSSGRCVRNERCTPGEVQGCWDEGARRVCGAAGDVFEAAPCTGGLNCLDGECTDRICRPLAQHCADADTLEVCNDAGDGYVDQQACADGSVCFEGVCLSGCDLSDKFPSYIGCQYWSLDLDNYPDPAGRPDNVPHAVVISNPSGQDAVVNVTTMAGITLPTPTFTVPAGETFVYTFPVLNIDGTGITFNSFFLESSWPVVAYQFNPLNNVGVASNDASLLLPSEFLGTEYIAMTWPSGGGGEVFGLPNQTGYVTMVATRPGTTDVIVVPSTDVTGGPNVPFLRAGEIQSFTLRQYEVLNLQADVATLFDTDTDLTGTIISASQPIAVFGGHEEAVINPSNFDTARAIPLDQQGDGSCCAEHLEEQLFPVNTWGNRYLAARSEPRGQSWDVWRVLASEPNTTIQTVPPQPDAATFTLGRGEWKLFVSEQSFEVVADKPILVGQFLASQETTRDGTGDPAFILSVPLDQLRDDYTVLVPDSYAEDFLTVMRPAGVEIRLDGAALPDFNFQSFGSGDFELAWIAVQDGPHHVEADAPFGLIGLGYSNAVSYGYPAGMNLRQ